MQLANANQGAGAPTSEPEPKLPRFATLNAIHQHALRVVAYAAEPEFSTPARVQLQADAGPMNFHFSLQPVQARQLALQLLACAQALDGMDVHEQGRELATIWADLVGEAPQPRVVNYGGTA